MMMPSELESHAAARLAACKERLRRPTSWFPYPCLISFGLIALFSGHLLHGLNPRLGNPAEILPFAASPAKEGALWMSVSLKNGAKEVLITTADRQVYSWPAATADLAPLLPFITYLKQRIVDLTLAASLAKKVGRHQSLVVLAVDQSLSYAHLRPLLYALANAGISEYAFETRQPLGAAAEH